MRADALRVNQLAKENRGKKMQAKEKIKKEGGQPLGACLSVAHGRRETRRWHRDLREIQKDLCSDTQVNGSSSPVWVPVWASATLFCTTGQIINNRLWAATEKQHIGFQCSWVWLALPGPALGIC